MSKHTPGPWKINKVDHLTLIEDHYSIIATIEPQLHDNEMENANLITAAPEMLEALVKMSKYIDDMSETNNSILDFQTDIDKLIKKAKGE